MQVEGELEDVEESRSSVEIGEIFESWRRESERENPIQV